MKRFITTALLSCLLVLGLGSTVHPQTLELGQPAYPQNLDADPRYDEWFQAKVLVRSFSQGYEREDSANSGRLKNDLGVLFNHGGIFKGREELKLKITEDDGTVLVDQVIKKKDVIVKRILNPKTRSWFYSIDVQYFELPKGKRITKGATVALPELGYSQYFDAVPEATPFIRTRT
jgi:hypothetical protein